MICGNKKNPLKNRGLRDILLGGKKYMRNTLNLYN